ncbi:MAG: 16S rRNA (cytosine(1402)-N(4))-methyltransferase RsmH [Candidatus Kaelpia imicola]|nr:16S rRNA (cytosine(1402)-N(4))-methyltransferase RsmH [Candidatus Kaelpia imicola]
MDERNRTEHTPVMLNESIDFMNLKAGDVVVDCTVGMGGHSERILESILPGGKLIAIDRDSESLKMAQERLSRFKGSFYIFNDNFTNIKQILRSLNIEKVDAVLFDLGISSYQLEGNRGFSFKRDAFLDMRMDTGSKLTAYDIVNYYSEREISRILKVFGEERYHQRIAHGIILARKEKAIETTKELSGIVLKAVPYSYVNRRINPATRTFQALRIAVNRELESIFTAVKDAIDLLLPEGRIVVISFHSLEDRIIKRTFRDFQKDGHLQPLISKPLIPSPLEVDINPRSRSAKLRAGKKCKNSDLNLFLKIFML